MLDDNGDEIDKELLDIFLKESFDVNERLSIFLSDFVKTSDNKHFESFGQQVDRIMGAAFTLSLNEVGELAKLGKELGYKSSQVKELPKLLVIHSLLGQLVRSMQGILKGIKKGQRHNSEELSPLLKRLKEANTQLGDLRVTVKS